MGARQRVGSVIISCYPYLVMAQKSSRIQDDIFMAVFIYSIDFRIVGEVVLKSQRAGIWSNS